MRRGAKRSRLVRAFYLLRINLTCTCVVSMVLHADKRPPAPWLLVRYKDSNLSAWANFVGKGGYRADAVHKCQFFWVLFRKYQHVWIPTLVHSAPLIQVLIHLALLIRVLCFLLVRDVLSKERSAAALTCLCWNRQRGILSPSCVHSVHRGATWAKGKFRTEENVWPRRLVETWRLIRDWSYVLAGPLRERLLCGQDNTSGHDNTSVHDNTRLCTLRKLYTHWQTVHFALRRDYDKRWSTWLKVCIDK